MARKATTWLVLFVSFFITLIVAIIISVSFFFLRANVDYGEPSNDAVQVKHPSSSPLDLVPDPEDLEAGGGSGSQGTPSQSPASSDDDGELHNGWDSSVSYELQEERFTREGEEQLDAYGMTITLDLDVSYPQLVNAGEHTEELNALLRDTAMTFTEKFVDNPSDDAIELVKSVAGTEGPLSVSESDALLSSHVTWAVTYNTDDFVSVSFSDDYCIGSYAGEYLRLRCVNMNLRTGETYAFDDVLTMNEEIAQRFVDTLAVNNGTDLDGDGVIGDDESFSVAIIGRDEWVSALMGEGDYADRVALDVFVDEKGRANLGVTYWLGNDKGIVRGWWDTTLSDELLESARKESTFWDLFEKTDADG